jgi:hypothetical protein
MQLQKEVGVKNSSLVDNAINVNDEVENNLPLVADSNNSDIVEVEEKQQAETIILGEGKALRLLALELFGDKVFWVYIYQENIDIIPNPNRISSGLKLKIPDIDKYFINNDDLESIYKAKSEAARMLEEEINI